MLATCHPAILPSCLRMAGWQDGRKVAPKVAEQSVGLLPLLRSEGEQQQLFGSFGLATYGLPARGTAVRSCTSCQLLSLLRWDWCPAVRSQPARGAYSPCCCSAKQPYGELTPARVAGYLRFASPKVANQQGGL